MDGYGSVVGEWVRSIFGIFFYVSIEKNSFLFSSVTLQLFWVEDNPRNLVYQLRVGRQETQRREDTHLKASIWCAEEVEKRWGLTNLRQDF